MLHTYDLRGVWDFSMAQMKEGCCQTAFDDTISLPGQLPGQLRSRKNALQTIGAKPVF